MEPPDKSYSVELRPAARRELKKLSSEIQRRIAAGIDELVSDPRPLGSRKMAGFDARWRIRVGDYRVIYEIEDDRLVVLVVKIGHRRDVYR